MKNRFTLFLCAVVVMLFISACGFNFSFGSTLTPTQVLNTYCSALAKGDYQTAYNQFASDLASKIGFKSEADLASAFKGTTCKVNGVDDSAGTGTVTYTFPDGTIAIDDYTIDSGQFVKQTPRSTPTVTLTNYCAALKGGDYQSAYNLLSSAAQGQTSETQFAAAFSNKVTDCTLSNVNDTGGTGTISYTYADGSTGLFDYTLVNANSTWAIDSENAH